MRSTDAETAAPDRRASQAAEPCLLVAAGPRPGGRPRLFAAVVVLAVLAPLGVGLNAGRFAPRLPSLDWTLVIDDRVRHQADAVEGRKVIFVGGSNLRFGLDAASLSRRVGVAVVNYGLHASLGIDVIADRAAGVIRPGDLVVYAPELSHFRRDGAEEFSDDLRIDFLAAHPSPVDPAMQSVPVREWYRARSRSSRLKGKAERAVGGWLATLAEGGGAKKAGDEAEAVMNPYVPAGIGPDGQIIAPRPGPQPPGRWTYSDPPSRLDQMDLADSRGVRALGVLERACAARGATLYVMPPMRLAVERFRVAGILPGVLEMERAWTGLAVSRGAGLLLPPGENVLDPAYGYDTDYHLNEMGVAVMEPKVAAALRAALSALPVPPPRAGEAGATPAPGGG